MKKEESLSFRRKGEIKTEAELKTLLENRGGKNFAERIFIESCVNQISNKSLQRLLLKGYWGTHAALKYARDKFSWFHRYYRVSL